MLSFQSIKFNQYIQVWNLHKFIYYSWCIFSCLSFLFWHIAEYSLEELWWFDPKWSQPMVRTTEAQAIDLIRQRTNWLSPVAWCSKNHGILAEFWWPGLLRKFSQPLATFLDEQRSSSSALHCKWTFVYICRMLIGKNWKTAKLSVRTEDALLCSMLWNLGSEEFRIRQPPRKVARLQLIRAFQAFSLPRQSLPSPTRWWISAWHQNLTAELLHCYKL